MPDEEERNKNNNKEDLDRVFDTYNTSSGSFQKVFGILIGAGLFFFFAAILPYFSIQFEIQKVLEQYANVSHHANAAEERIENLTGKLTRINEIQDKDIPEIEEQLSWIDGNITELETGPIYFPEEHEQSIRDLESLRARLENVRNDFNNEFSMLQANRTNLESDLENQKSTLIALDASKESLIAERNNLTSLWEDIQSPIGKVPIGFKDLAAVFPFSLAAAFLLCASLLTKTMRIRRYLHYLHKKRRRRTGADTHDSIDSVNTNREIAFIAPLWIDPTNSEQNKILQFVILLVPFVIFVVAVSMISYSWSVEDSPGINQSYNSIYYGLNIFSFGLFGYGYWHIIREWRSYSHKLDWWSASDK